MYVPTPARATESEVASIPIFTPPPLSNRERSQRCLANRGSRETQKDSNVSPPIGADTVVPRSLVQESAPTMIKTTLHSLLLLLAFSLPFEIIHPVLAMPWFQFTNLELLTLITLAVWLGHTLTTFRLSVPSRTGWKCATQKWKRRGKSPLVWVPLAFLVLTALSAVLAPVYRADALKFTGRVGTGILVFWMVIDAGRSRSLVPRLLWAMAAGAGVSAFVGLGEAAGWPKMGSILALFKEGPTRVGWMLRVGASFQYPTIAAGFFEMTALLAVALAATATNSWRQGLALVVAILCTVNVVLTLSRAGMVGLAVTLTLVLTLALRQSRSRPLALPASLTLGSLVVLTAALGWRAEGFRTRLVTENDLGWYAAHYSMPSSLNLTTDEVTPVTVSVRNTGSAQWHATGPHAFALGYYWLTDEGQVVRRNYVEVPLPRTVDPGDSVRLIVPLRPHLPPGEYRLAWGMLQQGILWFRHRNVPEAYTVVRVEKGGRRVTAPVETTDSIPAGRMPNLPVTVSRLDLWDAALRMWIERPLTGVGPDNFRHLYGRYLDMTHWDRRLHSNNLYLELLAGWGIMGTLAFAGFAFLIASHWLRAQRTTVGSDVVRSLALGASLVAFFIHGLLDYFLSFTSNYLLFWMIAGMIVAISRTMRTER